MMDKAKETAQQKLDDALAANPQIPEDVANKVLHHVATHLPDGVDTSAAMNQARQHLARDIIAGVFQEKINALTETQNAPGAHLPENWASDNAALIEAVHIERDFDAPQR